MAVQTCVCVCVGGVRLNTSVLEMELTLVPVSFQGVTALGSERFPSFGQFFLDVLTLLGKRFYFMFYVPWLTLHQH